MRSHLRTIWLGAGLLLGSPLLTAQNQATGPERESEMNLLQRANEIEKRVGGIKADVASVTQQLRGPSSPEAKTAAFEKLDDLQRRVDVLKAELNTIRMEMRNASAAKTDSPESLTKTRVIQSQRLKDLAVDLTNDRGQFTRGRNNFCIDFRNVRDGSIARTWGVWVDFTNAVGRFKAVRAVARLREAEAGRYCGEVTLPTPGAWLVTAKYDGPSGKGQAVFTPTVE